MTEIATLRTLMLHVLVFEVAVTPGQSRADRRRFFTAMHRAMGERDLRMSHCAGLCLLIPDKKQTPQAGRHAVLNWLIDQAESREIAVHPVTTLHALISGSYLGGEDDQGSSPIFDEVSATLLRRMTGGLLTQALLKLQDSRYPAAMFRPLRKRAMASISANPPQ
jgi:hypothetical protein